MHGEKIVGLNAFMVTDNSQNSISGDGIILGIDIGGTAVKAGLVDFDGMLLGGWSFPTPDLVSRSDVLAFTRKSIWQAASEIRVFGEATASGCPIACVGIAIPGTVSPDGSAGMVPNAKIDPHMLVECIREVFGEVPTRVLNDSGAAALGESWIGVGRGLNSFALVTLGTGIGCGIVVEGRLLEGAHGAAGEIGHMKVERDGRLCGCGGRGCLERYASGTGIVETAREMAESLGYDPDSPKLADARSILSRSFGGKADPICSRAIEDMCSKLGLALANLACAVDPEAILIGGGVSDSADIFIGMLRERFSEYAVAPCRETPIITAGTGNWAGTIGAARAAKLLLETESAAGIAHSV